MTSTKIAQKLATSSLSLALLALSGSAHATTGREAVGMCIDSTASGARCEWSVNDKGEIDICNKNGCVYCPSADSQCVVTRRATKPRFTLPVGTVVATPIGPIQVSKRAEELADWAIRDEPSVLARVWAWLAGKELPPPAVHECE